MASKLSLANNVGASESPKTSQLAKDSEPQTKGDPTNLSPAQQPSIARPQHLLAHKYGALPKMLSRSSVCRGAQRAFRRQCAQPVQRRGLAAPASGSFQYQTGDAKGVKFASRDLSGPTTTLALVSRAGTRYQLLPGLTEGLEKFAFRVWEIPLQHKIPFVEAVLTYECLTGN